MNYDDIVEVSKAYSDRSDIDVANNIDNFIALAEARINRLLRTREQSYRSYTPTVDDQEFYPLPSDYSAMRDIQLNSAIPTDDYSSQPFNYLTPILFNSQRNLPYAGELYYSIITNQIQIFPKQAAGMSIEISYYRKVPNLNSQNPTNWLSESNPDIYISGVTAEIELFVKNYDVAKMWHDRMSFSIDELDESDVKERWSGGPMAIRTE